MSSALSLIFNPKSIGSSTMEEAQADKTSFIQNWYNSEMELGKNRIQKYSDYDEMLEASKLASKAVKAHTDTTVSGGRGSEEEIIIRVDGSSKAETLANETFVNLGIHDNIWKYVYDMIAFGDRFLENVYDEGTNRLVRLKPLERKTMFVVIDDKGMLGNDKGAYKQVTPLVKDPIYFQFWQITHFHAGATRLVGKFLDTSDPYGVDMALPFGARRSFKQFHMMTDSLVMGRLNKSMMKYAYFYDTGDLSFTSAMDYIEEKREKMRKNRIIDSSGNIKSEYNPFLQDEDIILPRSEKLKNTDVKVLQGDGNLGTIDDIKFIRDIFISDLETPKPLLGFEEDTRTRATLSGMDVQFARTVRRWQKAASTALKMPIIIDLAAQGINPMDVKIEIVFPSIGTIDELTILKADQLRVEIIKTLALDVGLNLSWILQKFFGLSENETQELLKSSFGPIGNNNTGGQETVNINRIVSAVMKDNRFLEMIEEGQDFVNWRRGY